ncbi:phytanoyl-CoA dioxygenase family protein [Aspergillus ibericus CBS 121593]|uniref:Phytanoyl-CoA dioxygenase family protein n=1 Tax=Aspergillus ibericus CBS 121593 TaxID=1448316 RepID=A0A395GNB7_9EURO|nr:hypothetical protein BO80DRAFT_458713 [Aspergillus ibericus CBS 121593]RAK96816.1 hypothetical protein BO80DRAFT_458713 [Aspergillus ibericus CBS 121593]
MPLVQYSDAVQKVSKDTPVEEILYLLKRDGGVFVKTLVSEEDVDQAYQEAKPRLDADTEWNAQTQRAPSLIARSPTYTKTQVMNPLFRQVCDHVLTSRRWYWWGGEKKLSLSKPYVHSCTAMRIGPGGKAQPLHRDDYISHRDHAEIDHWDDARDMKRESAVGLFVAGCRITKENGGTQFIPRSHLWGSDRATPPKVEQCIFADMDKGDGFLMLASADHGGGSNTTTDEHRLLFATFIVRGYLRQEENQFLAGPTDIARSYDREIQEYMGYSMREPACGYVEQVDPIYHLRPELKEENRPRDF